MARMFQAMLSALLLAGLTIAPISAKAEHCWRDQHGRKHCDQGLHKGWSKHDHHDNGAFLDSKTKQILKGGLLGAGIGAGAGVLLDKPVGKTAVLGAGIGAGTQAVRSSNYLDHHPIVKTAAYGALAGAGASQLTEEGKIGKGALWGAAIGTGVGVLKDSD